ncbi:hypothetical protein [Umboniibacter marinipuniceus]|uniref:Transcriptional regulator SutA RNAP-binding domain-containing protein n=1 Tax=Umboniibacter marinipuniceus TaxID=569599 RepID=A0A3M0ALY7_9GAMM|nr:hypothetical protein DFR27_1348 [Umboniibacter marinipuniceus]
MKAKGPSKKEVRQQMQNDVNRFLKAGGSVDVVPRGETGRIVKNGVPAAVTELFTGPRAPKREYLTDVIKKMESRKKPSAEKNSPTRTPPPKQVPVYDDFGEIIRYEWR